jgi:hypothetical protein
MGVFSWLRTRKQVALIKEVNKSTHTSLRKEAANIEKTNKSILQKDGYYVTINNGIITYHSKKK